MTVNYPIVFETEVNGAVSAYVPGLPVYAAANSHAKAERAIRGVLAAYLEAHPDARSHARVRVARYSDRRQLDVVGVVPGIDEAAFDAAAQGAKDNCPISRALSGDVAVSVNAALEDEHD